MSKNYIHNYMFSYIQYMWKQENARNWTQL